MNNPNNDDTDDASLSNPDDDSQGNSMTNRAYEFLADVTYERLLLKRYFNAMKRHVFISKSYRVLKPRLRNCLVVWLQYSKDSLSSKQSLLRAVRHFRLVTLARAFAALNASALRARRERKLVIYTAELARRRVLEKAFQVWILSASACRLEREWTQRAEIHFYCVQAKRSLIRWRQWTGTKRMLANARMFAIKRILSDVMNAWKRQACDQKRFRSLIQYGTQALKHRLLRHSLSAWRDTSTLLHVRRVQDDNARLHYTSRLLRACINSWHQVASEYSFFSNRALELQAYLSRSRSCTAISKWREYAINKHLHRQQQQQRDKESFTVLRRFKLRRAVALWCARHKAQMDLAMIEADARYKSQCHLLRKCFSALLQYRQRQLVKHDQQLLAHRFNATRLVYAGWSRWRFAYKRSTEVNRIGKLVAVKHSGLLLKAIFKRWKSQVVRKRHLAKEFLIGARARSLAPQDERQYASIIHTDSNLLFPPSASDTHQVTTDPFASIQNILREAENKHGERSSLIYTMMNKNADVYSSSSSSSLKRFLPSLDSPSINAPLGGEPRSPRRLAAPRPLRQDDVVLIDCHESIIQQKRYSTFYTPSSTEMISLQASSAQIIDENNVDVDVNVDDNALWHHSATTAREDTLSLSLSTTSTTGQFDLKSKDDLRLQIETLTALIKIREGSPSFLSNQTVTLVSLLHDLLEREKEIG